MLLKSFDLLFPSSYQSVRSGEIPSDIRKFEATPLRQLRTFLKTLRRALVMLAHFQVRHLSDTSANVRLDGRIKILWVNLSAPSLGDGLMDLAPRALLAKSTVSIELLCSAPLADILEGDKHLSCVHQDINSAIQSHRDRNFDLFILDSFSSKTIRAKSRISLFGPVWSVYGFLNGFEVHRIHYGFHRVGRLVHEPENKRVPRRVCLSREVIDPSSQDEVSKGNSGPIVFAIGGEWSFRTYKDWIRVLKCLPNGLDITLLGSANGLEDARAIVDALGSGRLSVKNLVGLTSLREAALQCASARLFVGADGGLWHIASALNVPSVVLYADVALFGEDGERLGRHTSDYDCYSLFADKDVNEIEPQLVANAIQAMLKNNRGTSD